MRTVGTLTILAALGFTAVLAQDAANLKFEVASVRASSPAPPGARGGGRIGLVPNSPDRLTYERALFRLLLMDAFGVQRDQIKGAPAWATADAIDGGALFDISAKIPAGATKEQVATMLQNLLKERFKLSVHREQTAASGYALVVAKGGPKLANSAGPPADSDRNKPVNGFANLQTQKDGFPELAPERNMGATFKDGIVRMRFRDYPLSDLVQQFSFMLGVHVSDRTELTGKYDFTLEFMPAGNGMPVGILATLPLAAGRTAPLNMTLPNDVQLDSVSIVSSAMERQLGLKLDASKIAVETLVIDHVEKTPIEN